MPAFDVGAGQRTDAPTAILKRSYLPRVRDQLNTETVLMDQLKKVVTHKFRGEDLAISLRTGRGITQTVGDAGHGDTLPPRSVGSRARVTFDVKMLAHRIGISGTGMERAQAAGDSAIVGDLQDKMADAMESMRDEINRQLMGDASGAMATEITNRLTASTIFHVGRTDFLRVGMPVALIETNTIDDTGTEYSGTPGTGFANTVASIDSGTQITLAITASSLRVGSLFQRRGTASGSGLRNTDMFGLAAIINTDNPTKTVVTSLFFGNINRRTATNRYWRAIVDHNSGTDRPVSGALLRRTLDRVKRAGGSKKTGRILGLWTDAIGNEYGSALAADKRYPAEFVTLDGGFEALAFAGKPIVWDPDTPQKTLFWLNLDKLMLLEMAGGLDFEDRDGSVLFRVADNAQYEATLRIWMNLVATQSSVHVQVRDLREANPTHNL